MNDSLKVYLMWINGIHRKTEEVLIDHLVKNNAHIVLNDCNNQMSINYGILTGQLRESGYRNVTVFTNLKENCVIASEKDGWTIQYVDGDETVCANKSISCCDIVIIVGIGINRQIQKWAHLIATIHQKIVGFIIDSDRLDTNVFTESYIIPEVFDNHDYQVAAMDSWFGQYLKMRKGVCPDVTLLRVETEYRGLVSSVRPVEKATKQDAEYKDTTHDAKVPIVFVFGSCDVTGLLPYSHVILDLLINMGVLFIVGDAPGVDTLVQQYLSGHRYRNVVVYHTDNPVRVNEGGWLHKYIALNDIGGEKEEGFWTDHMPKDIHACHDCDFGVAFWDGKSRATEKNIQRLSTFGKRVIVGDVPTTENRCYIGTPTGGNFIVARCCQTGKPQYCYTEDMFNAAVGIQRFVSESLLGAQGPSRNATSCNLEDVYADIVDSHHPNVCVIDDSGKFGELPWYFCLFLNMVMSAGSRIIIDGGARSERVQMHLHSANYANVVVLGTRVDHCNVGNWKFVYVNGNITDVMMRCGQYSIYLTYNIFHRREYNTPRITFFRDPIGDDIMCAPIVDTSGKWLFDKSYTRQQFSSIKELTAIGHEYIIGFKGLDDNYPTFGTEE